MSDLLLPPCTYQGGKHRIARDVVDLVDGRERLLEREPMFYDICCGSGAVSLELMNRGFPPNRIHMCDIGPWGEFWHAVGTRTFDVGRFAEYLSAVPENKADVQAYAKALSETDANEDTAYVFLLLQAASFGGKQVWRRGPKWMHSSFRNYWQPTGTSVRRSPVNPLQPQPPELLRRVRAIVDGCQGITCTNGDVSEISIPPGQKAVVYLDPPYPGTTSYGYGFDVMRQVDRLLDNGSTTIYVSLNEPLGPNAIRLTLKGPKGGISGSKKAKHEEWLTKFN